MQSLAYTLKENSIESEFIDAIESVNNRQKKSLLSKIKRLVPNLKCQKSQNCLENASISEHAQKQKFLTDKKIALWGLSFKPKTDDIREAPSLTIIKQLIEAGAKISAFDLVAKENMKKIHKNIEYCDDMYKCLKNADLLVIITEWDEFRNPDLKKMKKLMKYPNIMDGRNIYNPESIRDKGFKYLSVGRK